MKKNGIVEQSNLTLSKLRKDAYVTPNIKHNSFRCPLSEKQEETSKLQLTTWVQKNNQRS